MSTLTIPDIDDELKHRLELRAAARGNTAAVEARDILAEVLGAGGRSASDKIKPDNLYAAIRGIVDPIGGIELELPAREPVRRPPSFE
jgi:antitoxin FitA